MNEEHQGGGACGRPSLMSPASRQAQAVADSPTRVLADLAGTPERASGAIAPRSAAWRAGLAVLACALAWGAWSQWRQKPVAAASHAPNVPPAVRDMPAARLEPAGARVVAMAAAPAAPPAPDPSVTTPFHSDAQAVVEPAAPTVPAASRQSRLSTSPRPATRKAVPSAKTAQARSTPPRADTRRSPDPDSELLAAILRRNHRPPPATP